MTRPTKNSRLRNSHKSPSRRQLDLENLENRSLLAVSASFFNGLLSVVGDAQSNNIEISRSENGRILVNDGEVTISGGAPLVGETNTILGIGLGGDDTIALNEVNGSLPSAILLGGQGNDTLIGGAGRDRLFGGDGNDFIRGNGNEDRLDGGRGNDTLLGDRGNDRLIGGNDSDLSIWNNGDGSDRIEGGEGNDTVQVNGADGAGDDFSIDPNGARVRFQRNNLGLFQLDIGTTENLDVNGQGGDDVIAGSVGLNGLISLDLDGGEGNDLLIGGDGVDTLRGGAGNDTLIGGKGNDVQLGERGDDLFVWNNGDGSDLMEGGDDRDTVQVNGADGAGDDFSIDPNGARVRFQRNNLGLFQLDIGTTEDLDVNGQGGDDVIKVNNLVGVAYLNGIDIDGGEGRDTINATNLGNTISLVARGGADRDQIFGSVGNDVLLGEDGNDFIHAGAGDDIVFAGDGRDIVLAGSGNDEVNGGAGNDILFGERGDDLLDGGDGFDWLFGGRGSDTLVNGERNF